VEIRQAVPDDAPRLTEIAFAAKRHWGYDESLIALWSAELTVSANFIATHDVNCATRERTIIGFYALRRESNAFELELMWVEPPHIGTGVGAELFRHAVRAVASHGGTLMRIASDPNAEGFYEKMGARRIGDVPSRPEGRTLPLLEFAVPLAT
jgi:GNAT superfamily N-acetyltransferase